MSRQIACIVSDSNVLLNSEALIAAFRARHPDIPIEPLVGSKPPAPGALLLRCAGEPVVIMSMPMPLPQQEWDMPAKRASAAWSEALQVFANHKHHLVVSTMAETTDRLQTARVIAAIAGALIASVPGCRAVLWESLVAQSAESWKAMSGDAFAPYPVFPYPLWVSLHPFQDGGKVGVISFGLSSFVGREIELEPQALTPEEALNKAAGLAVYLLQHGPALGDGDTFGATAAERIRVRHVQSKRVPGLAVLHATAEAA